MRRRVLVICTDREMRRHIHTTLREYHDLVVTNTMAAAGRQATTTHFDAIVLHVEPRETWKAQEQWLDALGHMCGSAKDTVVIGYVGHYTASASRQLFEAMGRGMRKLATREFADLLTTTNQSLGIRTSTETENAYAEIANVFRRVFGRLPSPAARIVNCCTRYSRHALSITELANHLSIPRRTMERDLAAAGLPSPEPLINWCRLLHAAILFRNERYTIEMAAKKLDFAHVSTFRSLAGAYLQCSAGALRRTDTLSIITKALKQQYRARPSLAA